MQQQQLPLQSGTSATARFDVSDHLLVGSIEKVVYFNDESGQCILDVKPLNGDSHVMLSGKPRPIAPSEDRQSIVKIECGWDKLDKWNEIALQSKNFLKSNEK